MRFQPYQDVLTLGLGSGVKNLVVPGAGVANYDSYEENPYASKKQKSELEVFERTTLNNQHFCKVSIIDFKI